MILEIQWQPNYTLLSTTESVEREGRFTEAEWLDLNTPPVANFSYVDFGYGTVNLALTEFSAGQLLEVE